MNQVNFRLKEDEKNLLKIIAGLQGIPISQLAKQIVLKEIEPKRIDIAFRLLKEGKCGRKRAWKLSGLSYHEFMNEWSLRNAEELIPDEIYEKSLEVALSLDLESFKKKNIE